MNAKFSNNKIDKKNLKRDLIQINKKLKNYYITNENKQKINFN